MKYKRILLKVSGESLMGTRTSGIDPQRLDDYANDIKALHELGIELAIVIGGGNIFRGISGASKGLIGFKATIWACWLRSSTAWRFKVP